MVAVVVRVVMDVSVTPTTAGMPGGDLVTRLLNWLSQLALWGSVASILIGAAIYGLSQHGGNTYGASKGRTMALAGAAGAILAGLAPTIVNLLYHAANGG